jgi:putative transposase
VIDLADPSRPQSQLVITLLLHVFRLFPFLVGGHRQLALGNLALRQQLAVYKRMAPRPRIHTMDRLFWAGLARVWAGWRQALVIVSPDTVLRWQRRRFRRYWTTLSGRPRAGRPPRDAAVKALIRSMRPSWYGPKWTSLSPLPGEPSR